MKEEDKHCTRARYISINVLCSARLRPCQEKCNNKITVKNLAALGEGTNVTNFPQKKTRLKNPKGFLTV
jgi:hypothetical protein